MDLGISNMNNSYSNKMPFGLKARPIAVVATVSEMLPVPHINSEIMDICTAVSGKSSRKHGLGQTWGPTIDKLIETFPKLGNIKEEARKFLSEKRTPMEQIGWLVKKAKEVFGNAKIVDVPDAVGGEIENPAFKRVWDNFVNSFIGIKIGNSDAR